MTMMMMMMTMVEMLVMMVMMMTMIMMNSAITLLEQVGSPHKDKSLLTFEQNSNVGILCNSNVRIVKKLNSPYFSNSQDMIIKTFEFVLYKRTQQSCYHFNHFDPCPIIPMSTRDLKAKYSAFPIRKCLTRRGANLQAQNMEAIKIRAGLLNVGTALYCYIMCC